MFPLQGFCRLREARFEGAKLRVLHAAAAVQGASLIERRVNANEPLARVVAAELDAVLAIGFSGNIPGR